MNRSGESRRNPQCRSRLLLPAFPHLTDIVVQPGRGLHKLVVQDFQRTLFRRGLLFFLPPSAIEA
jgi:hypothetical protein